MRETKSKQCKVVKNKNFTVMSNIHLRAKYLSLKAKGLMSLCLSLPENWDYSIAGLVKLSSDGRDGVTSTLSELKKWGFLYVEKERTKNGTFSTFYTFYENPKENPNYGNSGVSTVTDFPARSNRNGLSDTVNPMQLNRCGSTGTVNPEQINTNKEILKINTNNQLSLVKTDESVFTEEDLFKLYKTICIHYQQPRELTAARKTKIKTRLKEHPKKEFWETICKNAEKSVFIRKSQFFTFDWIIKNSTNPVKVFEGNYNKEEIAETEAMSINGDIYAKCYS